MRSRFDSGIHSFHIPVMGTAFSVDSPIKVAKYGISSVISIVDDALVEQMRKFYCEKSGYDYTPISKYDDDYRARRITAYLNLVDSIVKIKFEEVRNSPFQPGSEICKYFEMLEDDSPLKDNYRKMQIEANPALKAAMQEELRERMQAGSIDVNIMTKLDRQNFSPKDKSPLPEEYSDALSALRGYALSTLNSAIVFSAGFNRRLYSYAEKFEDFFTTATGEIKKKIVLKVSDYRSALIQGRFFAKKGLWVSEYRIESGLNCGGHAFATDGFLMGPILDEFKRKRGELIDDLHKIYEAAVKLKSDISFPGPLPVRITAQGGIGTSREQNFLMRFFNIDGTGWGSPFLLCPEVTNVDQQTLEKLSQAEEKDLYLSDVSPLGVPFNNLRGSLSDLERDRKAAMGKPGSACPKGYLVSNTEFTERPICTASRQYQKLKIDQFQEKDLPKDKFEEEVKRVTVKACICHDLSESVMIKHNIEAKNGVQRFTAICPGPNIAYFSRINTLREMVDHIYGRMNVLNQTYRPHMFIKELKMYIDYFRKEVKKFIESGFDKKRREYLDEFQKNLFDGIEFYKDLFPKMFEESQEYREMAIMQVNAIQKQLEDFLRQNAAVLNNATKNFA